MLLLAMPGPARRCDILAPLAGAATTKAAALWGARGHLQGAGGKLKLIDIEYKNMLLLPIKYMCHYSTASTQHLTGPRDAEHWEPL